MPTKSTATGAAFALIAASLFASAPVQAADSAQVQCFGVNACKGQNDCQTSKNACNGQSQCKGQGLKMMTQTQCDEAGGKTSE